MGEVSQCMKLTSLHHVPRLRMSGGITPDLPYAFTPCPGITIPLLFVPTHWDRGDIHFGVLSAAKQQRH
jgi:hypothetical protein